MSRTPWIGLHRYAAFCLASARQARERNLSSLGNDERFRRTLEKVSPYFRSRNGAAAYFRKNEQSAVSGGAIAGDIVVSDADAADIFASRTGHLINLLIQCARASLVLTIHTVYSK